MQKMKPFFIAWLLTMSCFTLYNFYENNQKENKDHSSIIIETDKEKWTTFKKFGPGSTSHPSTDEELKLIKAEKKTRIEKKKDRSPASSPMRDGRKLMGSNAQKYSGNESLFFMNHISPDWERKLGEELVRFQQPTTKVLVKKLDSIIQIQEGQGRYVEKVLITYLLSNGAQNSFNALIDSSSGEVLKKWNRTIHEHFNRQNNRGLTPTGSL